MSEPNKRAARAVELQIELERMVVGGIMCNGFALLDEAGIKLRDEDFNTPQHWAALVWLRDHADKWTPGATNFADIQHQLEKAELAHKIGQGSAAALDLVLKAEKIEGKVIIDRAKQLIEASVERSRRQLATDYANGKISDEQFSQRVSEIAWRTDGTGGELPKIYYAGKGGYAIEHKGGFIPLTSETQVAQHLRSAGVERHELAPLLCRLRLENFVSYIGPVAGHPAGIHLAPDSGQPFLVTSGPRIIEGQPGEFPFIADFLADLLGTGDQPEAVMAWLRQARRNVKDRQRRPLPASIFVGSRNCGKTLFIEITRQILGGRSASAFAALSGNTDFNGDVIGAELLVIDDEIASRDHRARTALAQGIKKYLFASHVRAHSKFREAVNMRPVHAVAIAVNDEPEHLQVLPAIDDSVADKISLFACSPARLDGLDDREEIGRRIAAELPAFVHYLDSTEHPDHLRNQRTGAAAWQSPEVLERLQSISPEEHLRELMTQCVAVTERIAEKGYWSGTAAEMEQLLRSDQVTQHSARSLLSWTSACGSYLAKLMTAGRCEITKTIVRGNPRWRITSLEPVGARQSLLPV